LKPPGNSTEVILILDDDRPLLEGLGSVWTAAGVTVANFGSAGGVSQQSRSAERRLMIPDVRLPGMSGIGLNHAVGRIAGTQWPAERGNIRPAAHRDGFFPGPIDIKIGDRIELRTRYGKDIDHRVHLKKPGTLPGFLLPSKFDLNLKFLVEVAHGA
jgi:hypothetical protein